MERLLHDSREGILYIAASHGATEVRLFGSRAWSEAEGASDVDLLTSLGPCSTLLDLVAIKNQEDLPGCPVGVVTEESMTCR